jgi:hypothetical protein
MKNLKKRNKRNQKNNKINLLRKKMLRTKKLMKAVNKRKMIRKKKLIKAVNKRNMIRRIRMIVDQSSLISCLSLKINYNYSFILTLILRVFSQNFIVISPFFSPLLLV